jgi:hypothetical protein
MKRGAGWMLTPQRGSHTSCDGAFESALFSSFRACYGIQLTLANMNISCYQRNDISNTHTCSDCICFLLCTR